MFFGLKSGFWIRAILRQFDQKGDSAMVVHKGDEDAGSIFIVLNDPTGKMAVLQEQGSSWRRHHFVSDEISSVSEKVDTYLERQKRYDPDLWIIELGVKDSTHPWENSLGSRKEMDKILSP